MSIESVGCKDAELIRNGDLFQIVQALETDEKLKSIAQYLLDNPEVTRERIGLAEFITAKYRKSPIGNYQTGLALDKRLRTTRGSDKRWIAFTPPPEKGLLRLDENDPLIACMKQLDQNPKAEEVIDLVSYRSLFSKCATLLRESPLKQKYQQLYEERFQKVVHNTVQLLKSKIALSAIYDYIAEERYQTALHCFHVDAWDFGVPRTTRLLSRITHGAERGEWSRLYHERILKLVPEGAKESVVNIPYYYTNISKITEKTGQVYLTTFCVIHSHIPKFEAEMFAGAESKSPFPRVTLVHTGEAQFPVLEQRVEKLVESVRKENQPKDAMVKTIGHAGFWEFKTTRYLRGSAAITETILASLCELHGLHLRLDRLKKEGKRLDLEGLTTLDCDTFTQVFANYVESKTG